MHAQTGKDRDECRLGCDAQWCGLGIREVSAPATVGTLPFIACSTAPELLKQTPVEIKSNYILCHVYRVPGRMDPNAL